MHLWDEQQTSAPPSGAMRLLEAVTPAYERDMIAGDLAEIFADRMDAGRRFNRLWFWTQAVGFALGFSTAATWRLPRAVRAGGLPLMSGRLTTTVRQATRRIRHEWRYSAGLVLILALGIGPAAAMLSVVDAVLLQPLPYAEPDRVGLVRLHLGQIQNHPGLSMLEIRDLRGRTDLFEAVEGTGRPRELSLGPDEALVPLAALDLTPGLLPMLGVAPLHGRLFTDADADASPAPVLLDYGAWQTHFGGDDAIVGRTILLNGQSVEVTGVLPAGFTIANGRSIPRAYDVYAPLRLRESRNFWAFPTVVRLADGVSFEQANAGLVGLAAALTGQYPEHYANTNLRFALHPLLDDTVRAASPALGTALAGVLLLLLVALANAAALVVAHLRTRVRDLGIRSAMGAGRGRLAADLLTGNVLLCAAGALAGAGLGALVVSAARTLIPRTVPRWNAIGMNGDVFWYAMALALAGLALAGLIPVWRVTRRAPWTFVQAGGPRGGRPERGGGRLVLAGAQIALTVALAFGAIQLARSAAELGA